MTTTQLKQAYQQAIDDGKIKSDENQLKALDLLQSIADQLNSNKKPSWFLRPLKIKGAYLYGAVGTGKTFLMDLFYGQVETDRKLRMHFYQFMQMVHEKLKDLEGKKNPLNILAKEMAKQVRLICFDEFFVVNIVDAMLLGNLFKALFAEGIVLVTTSNVIPDELYKDGLQRDLFLPAIAQLNQNTQVMRVDSGVDYRIGKADYDRAYFHPQDLEMKEHLLSRFKHHASSSVKFNQSIIIDDRPIETLYLADNAVWFDFSKICGVPRSQRDYMLLSKQYDFVFMSGLRPIQPHENDLITNFIKLIDVFYDTKTRLIILASVPIPMIYTAGLHAFEFDRTVSRLLEMQSKEYLA